MCNIRNNAIFFIKNRKEQEMKVLIIIPAYNEALNIEKTVKDVTENTDYDYIVVNDDLADASEKVASILRAESCKISRNKEQIQFIYKQYKESKEK